jgi:hypothetical protein
MFYYRAHLKKQKAQQTTTSSFFTCSLRIGMEREFYNPERRQKNK